MLATYEFIEFEVKKTTNFEPLDCSFRIAICLLPMKQVTKIVACFYTKYHEKSKTNFITSLIHANYWH